MTWTWPTLGVSWICALVILIAALLLGFLGELPREWVLLVAAVCAVRL